MNWDPGKYVTYSDYRGRPFFDLVSQIDAPAPRRVIDLGCGPGNLSAALAVRWPEAEVVGMDSSPAMIESACGMAGKPANLSFQLGDISGWMPQEDDDVIVSNAALQWVPGHQELLTTWMKALQPGAWLAVQVPGNFGADSHRLMREVADSAQFRTELSGVLRHEDAVGEPVDYLRLFRDNQWEAEAWETTYLQMLQGADPVLEWVRGTGLRPVLHALPSERAALFERTYRELLRQAYPATEHGTVFPFRRIFAVGHKALPAA